MRDLTVRDMIESLYVGRCNVVEYQKTKDPVTKKTSFEEVTVLEDIPCKLSFSSQTITEGENVAVKREITKLFLAPELEIKTGTKIVVTQRGRTIEYANSSQPSIFTNHQEITLDLFKGWS